MTTRLAVLAFALMLLPAAASAEGPGINARLEATSASLFQHDTWQAAHDAALARKKSGKLKMLVGLGAVGAGLAIAWSDTDADSDGGGIAVGNGMKVAGAAVFIWGLVDYRFANDTIKRLDAQRPASTAATIPLGEHHAVAFSAGRTSVAAYALSW